MSNHYDVIIIGTGAGGGTLAYRLAPSGKRILLLERGDYVPREKDNWSSRAVNVEGEVPHQGDVARPRRQAAAPAHELLRRRQHQVLRRGAVPPARARTSASCSTTAASRRPGRSPTTTSSRTTREAEQLYHVHGERGEDPTEPCGQRALSAIRPSATSRASSSCTTTSRALGLRPFHVPLGVMLDERNRARSRVHPLRHLRRLPVPACTPRRRAGRLRRSGARASERHAAHRRLRRRASRPAPSGREVTRGRRRARRRRPRRLHGRHRRRRRAARSTRRRCCCARPTTGIRAASPTAPTSSAATTWATSTRC